MNLELARSTLLEHSRSSQNGKFPETVTYHGKLTNPLCGDHVELRIYSMNGEIREIGFKARACAICSASASLISSHLRGKSIEDAVYLAHVFETSVFAGENTPWPKSISSFDCFEHLRVNPSRKMCALLPWIVLKNAFKEVAHD